VAVLGPREGSVELPPDAVQVVLLITFDVQEADRLAWHDVWSRVRQHALEWPACTAFRLRRSQDTRGQMVITTTWGNHEELNRFVRQSGMLWIDRALGYHAHYAVSEVVPAVRSRYQGGPQFVAAGIRSNVSELRPS